MRFVESFAAGDPVPNWLLSILEDGVERGWGIRFGSDCHVIEVKAGYMIVPDDPEMTPEMFTMIFGTGEVPILAATAQKVFWPEGLQLRLPPKIQMVDAASATSRL